MRGSMNINRSIRGNISTCARGGGWWGVRATTHACPCRIRIIGSSTIRIAIRNCAGGVGGARCTFYNRCRLLIHGTRAQHQYGGKSAYMNGGFFQHILYLLLLFIVMVLNIILSPPACARLGNATYCVWRCSASGAYHNQTALYTQAECVNQL